MEVQSCCWRTPRLVRVCGDLRGSCACIFECINCCCCCCAWCRAERTRGHELEGRVHQGLEISSRWCIKNPTPTTSPPRRDSPSVSLSATIDRMLTIVSSFQLGHDFRASEAVEALEAWKAFLPASTSESARKVMRCLQGKKQQRPKLPDGENGRGKKAAWPNVVTPASDLLRGVQKVWGTPRRIDKGLGKTKGDVRFQTNHY